MDNKKKKMVQKSPLSIDKQKVNIIINFFYKRCSERVNKKIKQSGIKYVDICPNDTKILSWIVNNKCGKNNKYLLCERVIKHIDESGEEKGLISELKINENGVIRKVKLFENCQELLWGDYEEICDYVEELFYLIIDTFANPFTFAYNEKEDGADFFYKSISEILCENISYAKNFTYYEFFSKKENNYPALLYGITEDEIYKNLYNSFEESYKELFRKCKKEFTNLLLEFTKNTDEFKKLDEKFKIFFVADVYPLLLNYLPTENSLGRRVRNLIKSDLLIVPEIILNEWKNKDDYKKQLINITSRYICELENLQDMFMKV